MATLVGRLPELGRFDHRRLAALAGLAAHACSGLCGAHHVWGGRARVRRAPSLAAFVAGDGAPRFKVFRRRLQAVGKPLKVANTACVSWLLTILNAMVRPDQDYRKAGA